MVRMFLLEAKERNGLENESAKDEKLLRSLFLPYFFF